MHERPLRIAVAPNGARRGKLDHPALPLTPDELAEEALHCMQAGAAMLHLHVRDDEGLHSLSAARYRTAIAAIRAKTGAALTIQVTTEAAGIFGLETQMQLLRDLQPAAASCAIREFFPQGCDERAQGAFFGWARNAGIAVQYILYAPDDVLHLRRLMADGIIDDPSPSVLFVLGRYTEGPDSDPRALFGFLDAWAERGPWCVCAFGPGETRVAAAAIALGGDMRVGFENNLHRPDGSLLRDNAEQVAAIAGLARLIGRDPVLVSPLHRHP